MPAWQRWLRFPQPLKAARRAGTPLLAVRTADPASAMAQVSASLCGKTEAPIFAWDIMGGIAEGGEHQHIR
jgi:hypothetical protein